MKTIQRGYRKSCKKKPAPDYLVKPIATAISSYITKERLIDIPILSISKDKTSSMSNKDIIVNKNNQIEDIQLIQKEWLNHCKKIPQDHPLIKPKEDNSHYMSKTIKKNHKDSEGDSCAFRRLGHVVRTSHNFNVFGFYIFNNSHRAMFIALLNSKCKINKKS